MRKPKTALPVFFTIRPEPERRETIQVEIWPNVSMMRKRVRILSPGVYVRTKGLMACVIGCDVYTKQGKRTGVCAVMVFFADYLRMGTLTHEAFHATMRWADRVDMPILLTRGSDIGNMSRARVRTDEERCADAHGNICRRLANELYRRKLLQ